MLFLQCGEDLIIMSWFIFRYHYVIAKFTFWVSRYFKQSDICSHLIVSFNTCNVKAMTTAWWLHLVKWQSLLNYIDLYHGRYMECQQVNDRPGPWLQPRVMSLIFWGCTVDLSLLFRQPRVMSLIFWGCNVDLSLLFWQPRVMSLIFWGCIVDLSLFFCRFTEYYFQRSPHAEAWTGAADLTFTLGEYGK